MTLVNLLKMRGKRFTQKSHSKNICSDIYILIARLYPHKRIELIIVSLLIKGISLYLHRVTNTKQQQQAKHLFRKLLKGYLIKSTLS